MCHIEPIRDLYGFPPRFSLLIDCPIQVTLESCLATQPCVCRIVRRLYGAPQSLRRTVESLGNGVDTGTAENKSYTKAISHLASCQGVSGSGTAHAHGLSVTAIRRQHGGGGRCLRSQFARAALAKLDGCHGGGCVLRVCRYAAHGRGRFGEKHGNESRIAVGRSRGD